MLMPIMPMLRTKYCPHCGEPYIVNDNPMNDVLPFAPHFCHHCKKFIKTDILSIDDMVGMAKYTKRTLRRVKKFAKWLAS